MHVSQNMHHLPSFPNVCLEFLEVQLQNIFPGLLSHGDLDERALDALKEFPADGGIAVLKQFSESNLEHVANKSAYLCGVMKTYRQRMNRAPDQQAQAKPKGPDEAKLKVSNLILNRS